MLAAFSEKVTFLPHSSGHGGTKGGAMAVAVLAFFVAGEVEKSKRPVMAICEIDWVAPAQFSVQSMAFSLLTLAQRRRSRTSCYAPLPRRRAVMLYGLYTQRSRTHTASHTQAVAPLQ